MTTVPATGGTSGTQTSSSSQSTTTLDYNDFLKLMVVQLQNQDPLNPTDTNEFMSQIAQFSNVEQSINANSKLDQLLVNSNISQASTMIGLVITGTDGTQGVVQSVRIDSSGSTAILTDGTQVPITAGVSIGYPISS
ncbi:MULTISPECIES: flagellar hook assembly protein FlgD [unclassified Hyphomicrobium]|uniref:flagellar hook assembly protein FlgD n=1 Tax=unclassified Hyphomicrobium TaxID=2619925 RepID=UPI000213D8D4|nr:MULTISPECIES: flagellar hook assembly protein FlgD [unclassified Hyphomicrobium]CCB67527.1 FlgD (BASAL-BODY ROD MODIFICATION PROTEIN)/hook formation protein [Hyphomicrobium sp. MC1]